jgi:hypothetical protein
MPPQQDEPLLDFIGERLGFRAHEYLSKRSKDVEK